MKKKIKQKPTELDFEIDDFKVSDIKIIEPNCQIISESYYSSFSITTIHEIYFKLSNIIYKLEIQKDPNFRIDCTVAIKRRDLLSQEYKFLFDETYEDFYDDRFKKLTDSQIKNKNYELLNNIIEKIKLI
jgi:hypothetical protein